jgi:hypothetical protein
MQSGSNVKSAVSPLPKFVKAASLNWSMLRFDENKLLIVKMKLIDILNYAGLLGKCVQDVP